MTVAVCPQWTIGGFMGCASTAQITSGGRTHPRRLLVELGSFYEKVVKVKADVPAILKFLLPIPQIEADHDDAPPLVPIGGMRKGGFQRSIIAAGATTAL